MSFRNAVEKLLAATFRVVDRVAWWSFASVEVELGPISHISLRVQPWWETLSLSSVLFVSAIAKSPLKLASGCWLTVVSFEVAFSSPHCLRWAAQTQFCPWHAEGSASTCMSSQ